MTTLAFILSPDRFRCNFVSIPLLEYPLVYYHDTLDFYGAGHDNVSRTRMATLDFILSESFPLGGVRGNFVSAS